MNKDTTFTVTHFIPKCAACGEIFCQPEYWMDQIEGHTFFYHGGCLPESARLTAVCRAVHESDMPLRMVKFDAQ